MTSEAAALGGYAALFALYAIGGRRVLVVARAASPLVDVGRVLATVGGGGHGSAGAASIGHGDVSTVRDALLAALGQHPPEPTCVADIMSSPVHTVAPDTRLADVRDLLVATGYTGVPVTREGAVIGMVSQRDLEAAERDERLGLPAASCMGARVVTTTPGATLDEALARMTEADVGRLPVLRSGQLVGIVTRADLLRVLYET